MSDVSWTVTEPDGKSSVVTSLPKLPHQPAIEITEKLPKAQLAFAEAFNAMRKRLIELNQMELK